MAVALIEEFVSPHLIVVLVGAKSLNASLIQQTWLVAAESRIQSSCLD